MPERVYHRPQRPSQTMSKRKRVTIAKMPLKSLPRIASTSESGDRQASVLIARLKCLSSALSLTLALCKPSSKSSTLTSRKDRALSQLLTQLMASNHRWHHQKIPPKQAQTKTPYNRSILKKQIHLVAPSDSKTKKTMFKTLTIKIRGIQRSPTLSSVRSSLMTMSS